MTIRRKQRSAEIVVETDEILVVRGSGAHIRSYCPVCRQEVSMVSPEQAAGIAGVSTRRIYASVKSRKVHFSETHEGSLLICLDSLVGFRAGLNEDE